MEVGELYGQGALDSSVQCGLVNPGHTEEVCGRAIWSFDAPAGKPVDLLGCFG